MIHSEVFMSKDSRKDSDTDRHTPILENGGDTLQRVEIITGTGRRRRWTVEAKAAIVAESFELGASVSAIARRHGISPSLLFLWRRQVTRATVADSTDASAPPAFVPVSISDCGARPASSRAPAIEIEVGAVRVHVTGAVDRRALREVLAAIGAVGR
jgi:transposase